MTSVLDIRDFVDGLIFNVLIGNADAHGKNYSMLYDGSRRRLAPFYNLVYTAVWPELTKRLAMNVGKSKNINEVTPDHFRKMAGEAGLGWPMVRERIASQCENVHGALEDHDLERTSIDPPMAGKVASLVSQRSKRMLSYLAKQR